MHEPATRRGTPLVWVTDGKEHIRRFLRETLSEFRFVIQERVEATELSTALDARAPDLVVLGLTAGATEACDMLQALADKDFEGKVLPFAPRDSAVVGTVQERAEKLRIALLPPLLMPFSNEGLRESIATLLPEESSGPVVDMAQAVREGWLELWYQPKIETRALVMRGAEALSRVRHPAWGIVPPAYFAPEDSGSPDAVSDAVISRAVEDWHRFFAQSGPIEIGINLPTAVLTDSEAIGRLCKQLPNHAAFEGLIVEVNSAELIRNLDLAMRAARQLRLHKVAIAIDDAGPEWLSLTDVGNCPFVEFRPRVCRRMCRGSIEAVGLPPHARARQILWLAHDRRWHRDLVGLLDGAGSRVRPGARISICKANERREVRAHLLGRTPCLGRPAPLEIDRAAQHCRRQRRADRNGRATHEAFQQGHWR